MSKKPDRLSALLERFSLTFDAHAAHEAAANFFVLGDRDTRTPTEVIYFPMFVASTLPTTAVDTTPLVAARVHWGGMSNPFLCGLPEQITIELADDLQLAAIAGLLVGELDQNRCGAGTMAARLGQAMMVRLCRNQIEIGAVAHGILAGLADPRLSRAIVAMHEHPSTSWRVETLAAEAGLSPSRFAELFRDTIGTTPLAYLRDWRLSLARSDIENGDRVQRVADRYCYGSTEALSRAIKAAYGRNPRSLRKAALEHQ